MAKYDWIKLKEEFILSGNKSIREFCKDKEITYGSNAIKHTKGWCEERVAQQTKKSCKIIEKVIEKESEKDAKQIVDLRSIANDLALNIIKANSQLEKYVIKNKKKSKEITYDYKLGKPKKEVIHEDEEIEIADGIIDRQGLKMIASALKDLNDILSDGMQSGQDIEDLTPLAKMLGVDSNE